MQTWSFPIDPARDVFDDLVVWKSFSEERDLSFEVFGLVMRADSGVTHPLSVEHPAVIKSKDFFNILKVVNSFATVFSFRVWSEGLDLTFVRPFPESA
jgi:hypothetical protein